MESGRKTDKKWLPIMIFIVIVCPDSSFAEAVQDTNVLGDFIYIPGMRMSEYNFWLQTNDVEECAKHCVDETRIYCKSFSFRKSKPGCGTYENAREDAPPGKYGTPTAPLTEAGVYPNWGYYERKTLEYKILEHKMHRIQNLTEISVDEATEVLSDFGNSLNSEPEDDGSGKEFPVSPGELDLMSQMMELVVNLNPIVNATAEISENFAKVLVNVSDSMMKPTHKQSWKSLQRDPNVTGIAGIVTSSEVVTRDVSERLLFYDNSTSIVAESENIGMWMDIVEFPVINPAISKALLMASLKKSETKTDKKGKEESNKGTFGIDTDTMYIFPSKTTQKKNVEGRVVTTVSPQQRDDVLAGDIIMVPRSALRNRSVVTHVRYKGLSDVIPSRDADVKYPRKGTTHRVNSAVLTTSVHPKPAKHVFKDDPVVIIFTHGGENREDLAVTESTTSPENADNSSGSPIEGTTAPNTIEESLHCVYWEEGDGSSPGGWSKEGCELELTNETHTICKCVHLTSFAVLLEMVDTSVEDDSYLLHNLALSWISYIGCALSLGGVLVMCGAFIMLKFHTENMKIHFNLGVAVGAADLVFMFEELAQGQQYSCILVTVLLYYFNMAVLSWMLIEGLFLYSQVVVVFVSARRWVKYYVFAGWGIPAIVMGISMGILNVQLGTNKICWLSPSDNSIWAFAAPAILVIFINFVILVSVVRVIVGIQPDQTNNVRISKVKNAVKGSIFLSPLLGTTWLFGLLSLSHDTLLFQYLFATTNSLQGFFLFVFHCLCNSEVRADFARRHNLKSSSHGGKSPPWFSGVFGLNVASGLRKFRDSISFDFASSSHPSSNSEHSTGGEAVKESPKISSKFTRREKTSLGHNEKQKTTSAKVDAIGLEQFTTETFKSNQVGDNNGTDKITSDDSDTNSITPDTEDSKQVGRFGVQENSSPSSNPGMPVKNDTIHITRTNKISPSPMTRHQQIALDPMLQHGSDQKENENEAMNSEYVDPIPKESNVNRQKREGSEQTNGSCPESVQAGDNIKSSPGHIEDVLDEDKKEAYKIPMSYDSGLKSIDNESLLEEEYHADEYIEMPHGRFKSAYHGCDVYNIVVLVRADFARRHNLKSSSHGGKSPPWFSGVFGLEVASGLRKFRDSISIDFASSSYPSSNSEHSTGGEAVKESPKDSKRKLSTIPDAEESVAEPKVPRPKRTKTSKSLTALGHNEKQKTTSLKVDAIGLNQIPSEIPESNEVEHMSGTDEITSDNSDTNSITPDTKDNKQKTHLLPPILGMPVKNDTIHMTRTNKISPSPMTRHQQINLLGLLLITLRSLDIFCLSKITRPKCHRPPLPGHVNEKDVHNNLQIEDVLDEDKKEAYKIPMSYDSGLNSIDNEYLLEEEYYADEHIEMPYGRFKVGIHGCDVVI
uniref:uncharacterized protein LOC120331774 n=1 Tax=Styela clava TaxID=7725 RepID=UPI00193A3D37|nr:uncharacterized protein LOC120331774 [Styela clava]